MDVVEYKLATNNPTLISHAIWKVLEEVKLKIESGESESKITELRFLLTQCESSNGIISATACQALVALAESGVLAIPFTLSNLTVCLGKAKHCGTVASAICKILSLDLKTVDTENKYVCPFTLKTPQHPLITVLLQTENAWRDVLNNVQTMMNHCQAQLVDRQVALLRPLFLYILCNPQLSQTDSCRQQTWHLVSRAHGTVELQIEILQWLKTATLDCCVDTNSRFLEITEVAIAERNKSFCSVLVPLLMSMSLELLKKSADPRSNLDMVSNSLMHCDVNSSNVLIFLLAEMITISPCIYLLDIISSVDEIIEKASYNKIIAHALIASILRWMAYPSILTSEALDLGKSVINKIRTEQSKKSTAEKSSFDEPYARLYHMDPNLQFYGELSLTIESFKEEEILPWLEKLSKSPKYVLSSYKHMISGIFLESNNTQIIEKTCNLLIDISKNDGQILPTILYKLANTRDISQTQALLFALPNFVKAKENLPIIIHTLKTLSTAGKPLNYLAIELYVNALRVEPRCHRYLQSALTELSNTDHTWQADVTCARAMKHVCEHHSENGAELVPLLSQILQRCSSKIGSVASALALNGISALCVAGVVEICSTWRVLAPKLDLENRSVVVRAICQLFGDIPHNPSQEGTTYDELLIQVYTKLWYYALTSRNPEIAEAAFKALKSYNLANMPLRVLPTEFVNKYRKSKSIADEDKVEEEKEENLAYIPAHYWPALLEYVNRASLPAASDFFRHFIEEELYNFRTGIYRWANGEPGNFKYLPEKSPLRAIGEHIRHHRHTVIETQNNVTIECMKIFAYKYRKPLPPIKFANFQSAILISDETKKYGLILACHQAQISQSAKDYLEKEISLLSQKYETMSLEALKEYMIIYEKLDDVCRGVGSNILGPFLEGTLNNVLEKTRRKIENAFGIFDEMMKCFSIALKDELIHHDNRSLIATILEKLRDRLDVESSLFKSYTSATMELPAEQLERMTLPSVWLNVTTEKLKKAIIIRAELVLKKSDATPLSWMTEIIRASASVEAVHTCMFEQMQRILPEIRLEKSNAAWTLDLMRRIGSMLVNCKDNEEGVETAIFLCEILFICVVCLSATDCLLRNDKALVTLHETRAKLFPQALANIVQTAHWKDIISQTMEWLNHVRTTPIPRMYKIVFYNALVSLRNEAYFDVMWTKYLSIRAPINE